MLCSEISGAPERIRTSDPQIRSPRVYVIIGSREALYLLVYKREGEILSDLSDQG